MAIELREGMSVKVIRDDVTGFVGVNGVIDSIEQNNDGTLAHYVYIDGYRYPFDAEELAPIEENGGDN